jgi:hypothetical protein
VKEQEQRDKSVGRISQVTLIEPTKNSQATKFKSRYINETKKQTKPRPVD